MSDSSPSPFGPIVLFDGVCNLCCSTVRSIIDRDPRGRIRFASLQSDAGRAALAAAGAPPDLPDSIVLIDKAGVHTRSTAALRIAVLLGLPTMLLAVALLVPRPVRDWVYGVVARHRYRWFGRRDVCMVPAPELRARFLDAGEPPRPAEPAAPGPVTARRGEATFGDGLRRTLGRFAIVYVVVYMLPFPFSLLGYLAALPGVTEASWIMGIAGWIAELHGRAVDPVVTWVGQRLFDVEAAAVMTGSGDTTFHFVDLLVDGGLALVLALAWVAWTRRRAISEVVFDGSRVLARYYLAMILLSYGWVKVFPLQFPAPGPDRLLQPYGDSSPMGLLWTFLGASTAYQMFAGLAELLGGYLLFFRRTTLLGSLVTAGAMLNVAAMNYFYDVPVKLFSTHLFLIAVFLLAPDVPRLLGVFVLHVPPAAARLRAFWSRYRGVSVVLLLVKLALIVLMTWDNVRWGLEGMRTDGPWAEPPALRGIYRVESFERDGLADRAVEDGDRWVRVGLNPPYVGTVQRASGEAVRMRLAVDDDAGTIALYDRGLAEPPDAPLAFTTPEEGVLRLEGTFEGASIVVVMRREASESLLTTRGFRWINEYPYNR